jgi:beta-galactosidase
MYKVGEGQNKIDTWMELITPTTANVLAYYNHPVWGKYAAITQNEYGRGVAIYIGCKTNAVLTESILKQALTKANLWGIDQSLYFPIITKSGVNQQGKKIHYYFNYSAVATTVKYAFGNGKELLSDRAITQNMVVELEGWGVKIIEEN